MVDLQSASIPSLKTLVMLSFRKATPDDVQLFFEWANDELVRFNSYNQQPVIFEKHVEWFSNKLADESYTFLVFQDEKKAPVGQVRFQLENSGAVIGILVDKDHRGKGYAAQMLKIASKYFHDQHPGVEITAYVKTGNLASYQSFLNAGYVLKEKVLYNNKDESFKLVKYK
jgi:RimJ/RimL family protein N-acetyltransferase